MYALMHMQYYIISSMSSQRVGTVIRCKCGIEESDLSPWLICTVLAFQWPQPNHQHQHNPVKDKRWSMNKTGMYNLVPSPAFIVCTQLACKKSAWYILMRFCLFKNGIAHIYDVYTIYGHMFGQNLSSKPRGPV